MLLFLKAPAEHVGHALQHTDVEVADMKVATNWPAESVKEMAQGIIDNFYLLGKKEKYHYSFIQRNAGLISVLSEVLTLFEDIMQILKDEGLVKDTAARCKALASRALLPGGERTRCLDTLICQYLDKEVSLQKDGDKPHNISSDIEESSFGLLKDSMPTCKMAGFTECVLRMPLYSRLRQIGRTNVSHVIRWMADTRMADVELWKRTNLRLNPLVRRRRALTRLEQKGYIILNTLLLNIKKI